MGAMQQDEFQTLVTDGTGFIRIVVSGEYSHNRASALMQRIGAERAARGVARVLLDASAVPLSLSTMDRYALGVAVASVLARDIRLAIVANNLSIERFGETVARNRGADVRVFEETAAALSWLTGAAFEPPEN